MMLTCAPSLPCFPDPATGEVHHHTTKVGRQFCHDVILIIKL